MQPVGWGYPPPAAPPTTAAGATGAGATPQPPPHAAVQPGLQQPCTTPWSMQPQVLAVRTIVFVARATLLLCVLAVSLCALRTCSLRVLCPVFRRRCPSSLQLLGQRLRNDPVLPNSASVARAAVPVTSCLTAAVSHAVPRWVVHVPFVNRPFESEIHGTVNFTQFCSVLLVTWCYRVLLSWYLRPKYDPTNVCNLQF